MIAYFQDITTRYDSYRNDPARGGLRCRDKVVVSGHYKIILKATVDLAYPSNRFMFGYMIDDTPMLFVKKPGADITMLNEYFEQGSFTLKDCARLPLNAGSSENN